MKIAIVELSESHEECIYTQVAFLKGNNNSISLIAHPKVISQSKDYIHDYKEVLAFNFDELSFWTSLRLQLKVVKILKKFDKVIFNTASSSKSLRNIVFFLNFYKVECIGIIHSVTKLNKSFTQKIFSTKIKKYLALSDFLKDGIRVKNKSLKLSSFYPIFFPKVKEVNYKKDKEEVWICIPGRVYFDRRDYTYLVQKLKKTELDKRIKFVVLGNIKTDDGLIFLKEIEELNLQSNFIFFSRFIPNEEYYNYLNSSDYIMPLLQRNDKSYIHDKITGTFNLAYAFKKELICDEFYSVIPDLKENGVFYNDVNFEAIINNLITRKEPNSYGDKKWNFEFQKQQYLDFVFKK